MPSDPTLSSGTGSRLRPFDLGAAIVISLTIGFSAGKLWAYKRTHILDNFHALFYAEAQFSTRWLGVPIGKIPLDTWVYQEVLWDTNPDVILEMGTFKGGSALYFASICDLLGHGRVITVDIDKQPNLPKHPRITYLNGSSTSTDIVRQIKALIKPGEKVMVSLDSDHHKEHVLNELRIYSKMVTVGQYLVVEDTDINGHPVFPQFGPGPAEALADFLKENSDFQPDLAREKFLVSFYPGGWLRRIR
jgi:cephalosporin hydroxylase